MKLWQMAQGEGPLGTVMGDQELLKAVSLSDGSPLTLREILRSAKVDVIDMQLAKAGAITIEEGRQAIPDFLIWISSPIFSDRAASLAIQLGSKPQDFWPCRFLTNPDEKYFFHLPFVAFDIVDFDKSSFLMTIPGDPPLPMFIQTLETKQIPDQIPPCFRASIPSGQKVLSELFIRDDFKNSWEQSEFIGAKFLLLTN